MASKQNTLEVTSFSMNTEGVSGLPAVLREPSHHLFKQFSELHHIAFDAAGETGWASSDLQDLYYTEGVTYHAALHEGVVNAFAITRSVLDEVELLTLAVNPQIQGQGVAQNIMKHVFANMKKNRGRAMYLEVRCDNAAALKVYNNLGFKIVGTRAQYYKIRNGDRVDAYTMQKYF